MVIPHSRIVLDACCWINIHASGQLASILEAIPAQVLLAEEVRRKELLTIQYLDTLNGSDGVFEEVLKSGAVGVVDFESEDEEMNFISFAAALRNDGEAASFAIAASRGYSVATDDKAARNFAARRLPHVSLFSTPEILRVWSNTFTPGANDLRNALENIRVHGNYVPSATHPLGDWWTQSLNG